jgi:hypothetical protein
MRTLSRTTSRTLLVSALLLALSGCSGGDGPSAPQEPPSTPDNPNGSTRFESDFPVTESSGDDGEADPIGDGASPGADDDDGGAERAIVEADVVQVVGNRLYALSRAAGLGVIDLSNPRQLRMLGSSRAMPGEPFEMYVRDGVVIAMYGSWGQYVASDDGYRWVQISKVVALDVRDPAHITELGSFDVPGMVSDSRIVGNVLYVVGYQDGWCWGCEDEKPLTAVMSLDVENPRAIRKVDELKYEDVDNEWGWNRRSITVTTERMYVAGPEWGGNDANYGSTIEVIDISDPQGDLVPGASLEAEGMIQSRWQMDEYDGVLRVISQTPAWSQDTPPVVQTFTVTSSTDITPLGRMVLELPRPEQLQSVRFDGARAYAVTFERTDPLFTIDLADPAAPKQMGELEMPGFLYYMQPRGDRLLGLGYDQGNPAGAITLSIFDVTNLAAPTMLDRVNFGGDWAHLPEDQDRIHKALRVFDELGLALVPFSGWQNSGDGCWGNYGSGVQLVDFVGDDLTLRGAVPSVGQARRALIHADSLVTFSDERVTAFDITNRAAPAQLDALVLACNVSHALPLQNGTVARVTRDWWVDQTAIDLVEADKVELAHESLGQLDLGSALRSQGCNEYLWIREVFARGNQLSVVYRREDYTDDYGDYQSFTGVAMVDASDPRAPRLTDTIEWPSNDRWYGYYGYGYGQLQTGIVQTDKALALMETNASSLVSLYVVDLRDPANLGLETLMLGSNDESTSFTGLIASGDDVLTSHYEPGGEGRVRFFFDRIDVSNPAEPARRASNNVPGSLLHLDASRDVLLTQELRRVRVQNLTHEQCASRFAYANFDWGNAGYDDGVGDCEGFVQRVNLVRLAADGAHLVDTYELAENRAISSVSLGDDRLFASLTRGYSYGYYYDDCWGPCGSYDVEPAQLLVLGGFGGDAFQVGKLEVESQTDPWWGWWGAPPVHASGQRALVVSNDQAAVIDARTVTAPKLIREQTLHGWLQSVHVGDDGQALVSLSQAGVQRIDMLR